MPERRDAGPRVLVVDDHEDMVNLLSDALAEAGFEVVGSTEPQEAVRSARRSPVDVALTDLRMATLDGFDVLDGLRAADPDLPVLIMTAFGGIDTAVEAMRRGAFDYVAKPFRIEDIVQHVRHALRHRQLVDENRALRAGARLQGPSLVGGSARMRALRELVARVADADVTVLIQGESGSGKERVARAIHEQSRRADRPFVAVNCASLPSALLESELFGHVRGAFTGASAPRRGLFVEADGGTLLLDEIGDMPLDLQPHLLRVLEDKRVRPVGADVGRAVDVRVLAATHQPLEQRVAAGAFRSDLFYRLDVLTIEVPPLRDRIEDLPELLAAFVARCESPRIERLSPSALAVLEKHPWPGNVRELENLVRRLAVLVERPVVERADLEVHAPRLFSSRAPPHEAARTSLPTLRQLQDDYIAFVIAECGGNKTRAAEVLGIDVSTIHRRERSSGAP